MPTSYEGESEKKLGASLTLFQPLDSGLLLLEEFLLLKGQM